MSRSTAMCDVGTSDAYFPYTYINVNIITKKLKNISTLILIP